MKKIKALFLMSFGVLMLSSQAFATDTSPSPQEKAESERVKTSAGTPSIYTDYMDNDVNEDQHNDGYIKPSFERLSQLYWALAMFDLEDDQAIDGYLMLHECDLYKQFFMRDFELAELRKVTRESIVHNLASFPTKFEIFMPVGLDRYDVSSKQFKIFEKSEFVNAKKLDVSRNGFSRRICSSNDVPKYARNFILYFNRPFTLTEIPMPPETAQEIIDFAEVDQKKLQGGKHFEFKDYSPFQRIVFLRLKVTMNQYKAMERNLSDATVPVIFATIDGYQIYFDKERTMLIYDHEIETKRKFDRLKEKGDRNVDIPQGPLLKEGVIEKTTVPQSGAMPVQK